MSSAGVLAYLWYPLFLTAAVAAFGTMLHAGMPLLLATYLPVFVAAAAIVALEWWSPERREWRPRRSDIATDAAFIVLVQVLIPRALAALAVLAMTAWMHEHAPSHWWPHGWPLGAQIVAMVVVVDFLRYWLHRVCHTWTPLWRLHEVHHSPEILYTLNTARFHPLEKLLHFTCDGLPFLLLGVAPEIVAGYFLVYAVNGFIQHSNAQLRYGWLNYLVGSAETHRWHHARDPRKAFCNFGSTTLVWDLVFRTWYLPKDERVDDIGIQDKRYPRGFWMQMLAPFRASASTSRRRFARRLADLFVPCYLRLMAFVDRRAIARLSRDPMRVQYALLSRILRDNRTTVFGREHGFGEIEGYDAYARIVPVMEFETLRPFVEREIERGEAALTREPPIQYMRTSGSSGKPKDIPLTRTHLRALRAIQRTSVALQYRACPEAFDGSILAIVSAAEEGRLSNGNPYGAASGIVAAGTPGLMKEKFVLPPAIVAIGDARLKYLLILRLAIARKDLTYFGSANSTTPLALMKLYREAQRALVSDVRSGGFHAYDRLPPDARAALRGRLCADPARADELDSLDATEGPPRIADLWPDLRMVVTWTCGSAGITVDALRKELPRRTRVFELGYLASEFRGTMTLGRCAGAGFPTLDTHFFEFAERNAWESGDRSLVTLDNVRRNVDYYVVATTPSGLYRYFINDVVRVTGFLHSTPLLKFVQKGRGVTNITGEKLYESHVLGAAGGAMEQLGIHARFLIMLADEEARRYTLFVEADAAPDTSAARLASEVDVRLRDVNVEYDSKRESDRLGAANVVWLRAETGEAYKRHCVAQGGQREGQFKCPALAYRRNFGFDIGAYAV